MAHEELMQKYDLEIDRIVKTIKKEKAKIVLLQFPDGLKPVATKVADILESKTSAKILIWMGSCFGACDIPNVEHLRPKIDLIIQFGHSAWPYK
jgi:diphthamide biosynthesis enzyme Dph1/Dph2-like protein